MEKNCSGLFKRFVSMTLTLALILTTIQLPVRAESATLYIPEIEIGNDILSSDVFYLTATNAQLLESGGNRYLLRIARGGNCSSDSGVTVKIADLTAKYGRDYTISLYGTDIKANNPENNESLIERIEGEEYTESKLLSEEEYAQMLEENEGQRQQTIDTVQGVIDYIEDETNLQPSENSQEVVSEEENNTQEVAAVEENGEETVNTNPLQQARQMYTGVSGEPQKVTSTTDTMQQIQQMANVITNAVVGANITIDFAAGEKEKFIAIDVKDNNDGDGDRYFYLMLAAPYGTTTNSAASSCAVTIVDDEELSPSEIGFSQSEYTADNDSVTIEIERFGAINTIVAAHLTAEGDSAQIGRDFSAVDMDVVFPMGIDKRTIDIPIRTEYLVGEAKFILRLEAVEGCEITENEAIVSIIGTAGQNGNGGIQLLSIEEDYRVSDIVLGDALNLSSPVKTGTDSHYDGYNHYDGNGKQWHMMWRDNISDWTEFWTGEWYNGMTGASWKISDTSGAGYAGVQVDWARTGSCANMLVLFVGSGSKDIPWNYYNGGIPYSSKSHFGDGTITNIFCDYWDPYRVSIINQGACDDCNQLWVHNIKQIYRPFVINLLNGDAKKFLNADGTYSEYKDATFAALSGANNDTNNQVIRYMKDGQNDVTIQQTIGKNISTPYVYLKKIDIIKDGKSRVAAGSFEDDGSTSRNFTITSTWLDKNRNYIFFEENNVSDAWKNQTGTFGLRGRVELKPVFEYKDAEVKINVPSNNFGYFKISGSEKNISSSKTYTYHRGDILKLSTVMRDEYKELYEPAGYKVSYKHNKSDVNWIKKDVIVPYSKDGGTSNFLDDNERLRYGYYEITPLFQKSGNTISVRVKKSDISKFDTYYGFFNTSISENVTIDGVEYKEYILFSKPVYGNIYAVTARLKDTAGKYAYQRWTEAGNSKYYGGEVFFHEAANNSEDNVITLSCVTEKYTDIYQSVKGSVFRPSYNMQTRSTGYTNMLPAQGAIVNFGGAFSVVDGNGEFETVPFRAMNDYADSSDAHYIRYVISVNGEDSLREMRLSQTKGENKNVGVINNVDGSNEITQTKVWVNPQNVGQQLISAENGSIINNIEVYTDNLSYGNNLIIDGDTITVKAKMREPVKYTKVVADEDGGLVEHPNTDETVTGIKFIIYDAAKNTQIASYNAENKNGEFVADIPLTQALPGNRLYISVTTDKSHGIYSETAKTTSEELLWWSDDVTESVLEYNKQMNSTTYADVFTGYTFISKTTEEVPVLQHINLPIDMKFESLPFLGDTGIQFDLPFCSVGSIKTDTGYKLYIGVSPTQIADKVKGTHMTTYAGDTGAYYKEIFSIKNPIKTFAEGLATSYNDAFKNVPMLYEGATSALGAPTWKMDVQVGVYFDFVYTTITNPNNGDVDKAIVFSGVGGYIGVSAGVKMAWYTILPVVFIPAYFGIDISGNVLGFFGAGTDTSKPKISYDEAQNATVNFDNSLDEFNASVKMAATVQIYVGVGLAGTLGLRGGGTFNAMGLWEPSELVSDFGANLKFTAGIWVDLFLFSVPLQYSFPDIKFGSFEEYANLTINPVLMSDFEDETPTFTVRQPYSDEPSEWLPPEISLMSAFSETSSQTIVANGYEHPDTQMLKLSDGGIFMAFLDSDVSRGVSERTVLKYSVYRDGTWSEPQVVQNDNKADFQPSICEMNDGKVMISWLSSDPEKETTEDSSKYLSNLEVYTAVIDTQNGDITGETRLTNDECYDYTPTSVYDDKTGDRIVYYVKTASNGSAEEMINSYTNDCVVVYMLYSAEQDRWLFDYYYDNEVANDDDRQYLIENWKGQRFLSSPIPELGLDVPNISDFTAISYSGISVYGYTIDKDSSNDTSYDKELFIQCYDFETHTNYVPVRITKDNLSDALPQFVRTGTGEGATTRLFWYRGEKDVAYIDISSLVKYGVNSDGSIKDEYLTGSDGEIKDLEALYSYVSASVDNFQGLRYMADFRAVVDGDDIYVVWTQPVSSKETDEDGNYKQIREVFATAMIQDENAENTSREEKEIEEGETQDETGSSWADPYRLTYTEAFTDEPNAVIDADGNLMVLYNSYNQTITNDPLNPVEITDFSLKASYMEPCGAVDVIDMTISDMTPMAGDVVNVSVEVKNSGLTYADGYKVDIYEMNDGIKGALIKSIEHNAKLLPGNTNGYEFEWTVPETVKGVSLYAVAQENGMSNISEFESTPLETKAIYSIDSLNVLQDEEGYHLDYTITNSGNAESASDDNLKVIFTGPYSMSLNYSNDECNFATASLGGIGIGETKTFTTKLTIVPTAFDKYGYVDCLVIGVDKDGRYVTDGESVRIVPSKPLELLLNGEPIPDSIEIVAGETLELDITCNPQILSDAIKASFGTDDTSVATFNGNTLIGMTAGTTVIHGSVLPYGTTIKDIAVTVTGEAEDTSDEYPTAKPPYSGGSVTRYTVTFDTADRTEIDDIKINKNGTINELPVPQKEGYIFAGWYTDQTLTIPFTTETKVTKNLKLYAKWIEDNSAESEYLNPFKDVADEDWFYDSVKYAYQNGLFSGTTEVTFAPSEDLTRAMLVTVLYRAEGKPKTTDASQFIDVADDTYYADAVAWAQDSGIVHGVSKTDFAPDAKITREQIATIIYRYAVYKGLESVTLEENLAFTDADEISEYAVQAMNWIVGKEFIKGYEDDTVRPKNNATRAEAAAVLHRFLEKLDSMTIIHE